MDYINISLNLKGEVVGYDGGVQAMQAYTPGVLVLTDISSVLGGYGEPDDMQSLIRLLLYANELELDGLCLCE